MTEKQTEIIKLILESNNPEEAVKIFAAIIDFLKSDEATDEQVSVFLRANCQTSP